MTERVHVIDQSGQPYGSVWWCCNRCGVMLTAHMTYVDSLDEWMQRDDNCSEGALPAAAHAAGTVADPPAPPVTRGSYSKWTCLDWYDGPLTEIALVTFKDGRQLAEIKCQGGWVGEDYRTGRTGEKFFVNHMRLDRETLVAMLDLLDGKPVKDFHD